MNRVVISTLLATVVLSVAMTLAIFFGDSGESQTSTIVLVFMAAIMVCIVIMSIALLKTRKTMVEVGDKELKVHGMMVDVSICYNDIKSIETRDEMFIGVKTIGVDLGRYVGGSFTNKEFGLYKISLQCNIKKMIIIRHLEGTLVFNQDSIEATLMTYESIKKRAKMLNLHE